ncbi:MAG: hypothetical protein ACFFCS_01135 [Candidatus Hodarchaeota archaeon]
MSDRNEKHLVNHEEVSKMPDVDWIKDSITKGKLWINEKVHVEFDFKDIPKFKVFPKEARKKLPRISDLLPDCVLWEEDSMPPWADILKEIKKKLLEILETGDVTAVTIKRKTIDGLLQVANENYPNEVFFLLRKDASGIISEAILPQGAKGGETLAYFLPSRLPFDKSIVGTFHSHPTGEGQASGQDLDVFRGYKVNIIAHPPFQENSFKIYDGMGNKLEVEFSF